MEEHEDSFLNEDRLQNLVTQIFFKSRSLAAHQLDSFNEFCEVQLPALFEEIGEIEMKPDDTLGVATRHARVKFEKVYLKRPEVKEYDGTIRQLMPQEARMRNMTYAAGVFADISVKVYVPCVEKMDSESVYEKALEEEILREVQIGEIPVMVLSRICHLSQRKDCCSESGGNFIVKGSEKVLIAQEENFLQRVAVSDRNGWKAYIGYPNKGLLSSNFITVNLKSENKGRTTLSLRLGGAEIPIAIALRALGVSTDRSLFEVLTHDVNDGELGDLVRESLQDAEVEMVQFLTAESSDADTSNSVRLQERNLEYIGRRLKNTGGGYIGAAKALIDTKLFPHLGPASSKALFLGYMARCLCLTYLGRRRKESIDSLKNKRIDSVGTLFSRQFKQVMDRFRNEMCKHIQKHLCSGKKPLAETFIVDKSVITKSFQSAFQTGNWSKRKHKTGSDNKKKGSESVVVATLSRVNSMDTLSHLRQLRTPSLYSGKIGNARYLDKSHYGRICPVQTPDNDNCGLVKTMALFSIISSERSSEDVVGFLSACEMQTIEEVPVINLHQWEKIFVNGTWIGVTRNAEPLLETLRKIRREGLIDPEVEIAWNHSLQEIRIFTDAGRVLRPLFIVENGRLRMTQKHLFEMGKKKDEEKFPYLLEDGVVELLGPEEEESCFIASSVKDLRRSDSESCTHMELHPASILSVSASLIPFLGHNHSSRVMHQAQKHAKQAIGFYSWNPRVRCDRSSHQLFYPQKPLVTTRAKKEESSEIAQILDRCELMNGQNCIVAVACYSGYNQEDSIILNQASLDRGLFRSLRFQTYSSSINPKKSVELFGKPSASDIGGARHELSFDHLDSDGFPYIGATLGPKHVVMGKILPSEDRYADRSVSLKNLEQGWVEQVVLTTDNEDTKIGKVRLAQARVPQVGDKFSSMHGQKGVVGMCFNQEDLLFTQQGIVPDLIINPHAFPTRMTLAQLLESVAGKAAAMGCRSSSTPFDDASPEALADALHRCGYEKWGTERFYSGFHGRRIKAKIFVGTTFYQRLIHMAQDKIKWRRTGPVHPLTRQPITDRQRHGGIKFGEMERDCLIAHGASAALQERLFTLSDPYQVLLCTGCQRMASSGRSSVPGCRFCKSKGKFVTVDLPYSCKLLIQELNSMCIDVRIVSEPL